VWCAYSVAAWWVVLKQGVVCLQGCSMASYRWRGARSACGAAEQQELPQEGMASCRGAGATTGGHGLRETCPCVTCPLPLPLHALPLPLRDLPLLLPPHDLCPCPPAWNSTTQASSEILQVLERGLSHNAVMEKGGLDEVYLVRWASGWLLCVVALVCVCDVCIVLNLCWIHIPTMDGCIHRGQQGRCGGAPLKESKRVCMRTCERIRISSSK